MPTNNVLYSIQNGSNTQIFWTEGRIGVIGQTVVLNTFEIKSNSKFFDNKFAFSLGLNHEKQHVLRQRAGIDDHYEILKPKINFLNHAEAIITGLDSFQFLNRVNDQVIINEMDQVIYFIVQSEEYNSAMNPLNALKMDKKYNFYNRCLKLGFELNYVQKNAVEGTFIYEKIY